MNEGYYISIIIPAYNEEKRLPSAVKAIKSYLESKHTNAEIIVVDDGSTDNTAVIVKDLINVCSKLRLISLKKNYGKGAAVKVGMLAGKGQYLLFTDADQSTPIDQLEKLLPYLNKDNFDIAIGSRAIKGANIERGQSRLRQLAGYSFGTLGKILLYRGIRDSQCGFKLMTHAAAQKIFPKISSSTAIFDMELLVLAGQMGCRVAEVPVRWIHDPDTRLSYNLTKSIKIFMELIRIKVTHRIWWPVKIKTH